MLEKFVDKNFHRSSVRIIDQANAIIAEYEAAGFSLTLRQLYYQFVARDIIPNKQTEYKRLGSIINDARLAGLIDWDAIEDRTRFLRDWPKWKTPAEAAREAAKRYKENLWDRQDYHVEVWIEKDALIGVVEPVCARWRIPHFACRGYTSQSEQYVAGKRLENAAYMGQTPVIIHLGDHDPSGIDMTRDNDARLTMFSGDLGDMGHTLEVRRIALNMDQIDQYAPPPNPAKESDSRIDGYVRTFGTRSSWELDALDPKVIDALIDAEIRTMVDEERWDVAVEDERVNRQKLIDAAAAME